MARVRSKDTKPEMLVRRMVFGMEYRYRLHSGKLPGRPDLVFPSRKKAIFVHGCYWHRHEGCALARYPKSRTDFWISKLEGNKERDTRKLAQLTHLGWKVLIVWECELRDRAAMAERLRLFLETKEGSHAVY
jgi:DNA mismatch endonuclease (patch repair protein)